MFDEEYSSNMTPEPTPDVDEIGKALRGETEGEQEQPQEEPEQPTEPEEEAPEEDDVPSEEEPTEATQKPATDPWQRIREMFEDDPEKAVKEIERLKDTRKNLERGYNQKFQEFAEKTKQAQAAQQRLDEINKILGTDQGRLAMQLAQQLHADPAMELRLQRALEQVTVPQDEITKKYIERNNQLNDQRYAQLEQKLLQQQQMQEQARIASEQQIVNAELQKLADARGIDFRYLRTIASDKYEKAKADGVAPDTMEGLNKLFQEAAEEAEAPFKEYYKRKQTDWKKEKEKAARVAPQGGKGGRGDSASRKTSDAPDSIDDVEAKVRDFFLKNQ